MPIARDEVLDFSIHICHLREWDFPPMRQWEMDQIAHALLELTENQVQEIREAVAVKKRLIAAGDIKPGEAGAETPSCFDAEYVESIANGEKPGLRGQTRRYGCDPMRHELRYDGT